MAQEIVPANLKVPAHLASRVGQGSSLGSSISGGLSTGTSVARISIKASRFRIIEGGAETVLPETSLDIVIVGANPNLSKLYYEKTWKPDDEPTQPDCSSVDGIRPVSDAPHPQADTCMGCPQNAWGSKIMPNGQKIKACSDLKRLAVVAADDPGGPIYLLLVTPAALKGLNQYQKELSIRGIPPEIVKTRVSFDTSASFPKLTFAFGGFLDASTQEVVDGLFDTPEVRDVTGEAIKHIAPLMIEKPSPVKVKPVEIEPETVEGAEPVKPAEPVKRGFGAAKAVVPPQPIIPTKPKRVVKEPAAAPTANVADEIADLIKSMKDDDEADDANTDD